VSAPGAPIDLRPLLEARAPEAGRAWFAAALARARDERHAALPVLFPGLARRLGRLGLAGGLVDDGTHRVDLDAWRTCDAAGRLLLDAAGPHDGAALDLYLHGDMEERTIVLRSLALGPITPDTIALLGEVQRTNMGVHLEAAVLDSNLAVRALEAGGPAVGFAQEDLHRLVLKLAFVDLPIARAYGVLDHATPALSQMLVDFALEREAAGRPVWADTWRFLGHAPIGVSAARLRAGLAHADPAVRRAAVDGVVALGDAALCAEARQRRASETDPGVRRALDALA
jgi:hypothetical protein